MLYMRKLLLLAVVCLVPLVLGQAAAVDGAELKIGVINVQKVLANSDSGKAAKERIDAKMNELKSRFAVEEKELADLQKEIEKKSSAWSEETRQEKVLDFQKKRRDLKAKTDDARFELKSLQDKELAPILKTLEKVVNDYASVNKYTVILDAKNQTIYFAESIDLSDKLIVELDAAMAQKQ